MIGFYTSLQHSIPHSSTSPDVRVEVVISSEHAFEHIFSSVELSLNVKREISDQTCAALYEAYRQTHVSEAQFACIPSKDEQAARLRPTRKRHLQHSCSSRASAANLSRRYCSRLSLPAKFLHSKSQKNASRNARKICMLVVGKEASTLVICRTPIIDSARSKKPQVSAAQLVSTSICFQSFV